MKYANYHIDDIIVRLFAGKATEAEQAELEAWAGADPSHRDYLESQRAEWTTLGGATEARTYDSRKAWERFAAHTAATSTSTSTDTPHTATLGRSLRRIAAAAAIIVAVAGIAAAGYLGGTSVMESRLADIVVEAPEGSRTKITLPDGTTAWLNAGSRMAYSQGFGVTDRTVHLTGEGYFEVGHKSGLPLTVCSDNMTVRDIGTKFNFRDYPEETTAEVSLCEGLVGVASVKHPDEELSLQPTQQAVVDKRTGRMTAGTCSPDEERLWTSGMLVMDGRSMRQIARAIERCYKVYVVIADRRVDRLQICGTLNTDRQELTEVLHAIAKAGGIAYSVSGNTVYLR